MQFVAVLPIVISACSLVVAILSWRFSHRSAQASAFNRRFEVYEDVESFVAGWQRDGRPDMSRLGKLQGAWSRSHFLCRSEVTQFIRKMWIDAVDVDFSERYRFDEKQANKALSIDKVHELSMLHMDPERLRDVFMPDLRIGPRREWWRVW